MEEILATLQEIFRRDCQVDVEGGTYILREPKESSYPLTRIRQKGKMLLYSFDLEDSNASIFGLFNPSVQKLTSICDYFTFYPFQGQLYVFICDLKSGKTSAKSQIETGYVLSQHIVQMLRKQLKFKTIAVECRALVLSTKRYTKGTTTVKNNYIRLEHSGILKQTLKAGEDIYLDNLCYL